MAVSAARSLTKGKKAGAPLPRIEALRDLYEGHFGFMFRQSEITMIAGLPGCQKSGFALWAAQAFDVPTLYFMADSSSFVAATRLVAAMEGVEARSVGQDLGDDNAVAAYESVLDRSKIRFVFNPDPDAATIKGELDAWVEAYDSFPTLIVVDNLMDVLGDGENETQAHKEVLLGLKRIARETEAAIFVLHHMLESDNTDPRKPAPRKKLAGKVSQTAENVISIAMASDTEFQLSVVKHRSGKQDAMAEVVERLRIDPARNTFEAWPKAAWTPSGGY